MKKKITELNERLTNAGIGNAARELKQFLAHQRKIPYSAIAFQEPVISDAEYPLILDFVERRINGEPFTKIIGESEFYGLRFKVTRDTLDPRPDSEMLIDTIKRYYKDDASFRFLDLGTGTGALSITILKCFPNSSCVAVDLSKAALDIAIENAAYHNVQDLLQCIQSSWFENVPAETFDFIISNPPYIAPNEPLVKSVLNYDPHMALFGGEDGLDCYRAILKSAKDFLKPNGYLFFEIGYQQGGSVPKLGINNGFTYIEVIKDYGKNDRVVVLRNHDI